MDVVLLECQHILSTKICQPFPNPYIRKLVCLGIHSGYGEQREAAGNYFFLHNK